MYTRVREAERDHDIFPGVPVLALTATAPPPLPHQKAALLQLLQNPAMEITSVNKPNLFYRVMEFKSPSKPGKPNIE